MSFNVRGAVQVPLELFGGLCTEQAAANLPLGVSPDCFDMAFRPGAVFSRPGLTKVFATSVFGSTTIVYAKSYVANDGAIYNLFLDAVGNIWSENITASLAPTIIGTVAPGSYAKSVTAFGREYIAFSDGLHGTDVALQWDGTFLDRVTTDGPGTPPTVANLALPAVTLTSLVRASNVVTGNTGSAHGLKVGNQVQIANVVASVIGGGISSIVINNEQFPGVATVTTASPHGLVPNNYVSLTGILAVTVPGGSPPSAIFRHSGVVTIVTTVPHGLSNGAYVTVAGCADASFDATYTVQVVGPQTLTATVANTTDSTPSASGTTLTLNWPLPFTTTPSYFEVLSCPTATSFQVPISYADCTFNSGTVSLQWDGVFYVASVPSATEFTYQSYGPDLTAVVGSPVTSTATPFGQISPGLHQVQVSFLTRQGYITQPSPPVKFEANGGQYLAVSNIPVGPANIVARILEFTGAEGSFFYYIPVPAQVSGQVVSTATQINDNTTTSVVLDFSDNTLFASLGTSTQGNYLANQIILDSALGFAAFATRLITYGQREVIQNLLNMSFDGGSIGGQITGWTGTGTLVSGHFSEAVGAPNLTQGFYEDAYGAPIATPNQQYIARAWMEGSTGCTVTISSVATGFTTSATLTPGPGGWGEAPFSLPMPATIPTDMKLSLVGGGSPIAGVIDHLSIVYASLGNSPIFLDRYLYGSYVNNPEAFDGVSGEFGVEENGKVMTEGIIRGNMFVLTRDPGGRLHSVQSNGTTEPAGWTVNEVAANCGAMSPFCMTNSQADDGSAGGGEEWLAWMSYAGARIFGGNAPDIISKEITPTWQSINTGAWLTTWALNDPAAKRIYFGVPIGIQPGSSPAVLATAPSQIFHMDYKELDGAEQIADSPPIHLTFTGKLSARDHARKWCPWRVPANGAALMYLNPGGPLFPIFFVGNAAYPGTVSGGPGNVFTFCDDAYTDDYLGEIFPYYFTAAFASAELEQALQLGGQRHLLYYLQWYALGFGNLTVTPHVNTITNPWPITATLPLRTDPTYDDEWGGGQASGQRIFLKFAGSPA